MKNLIERQSELFKMLFWTYVELLGIDPKDFAYRFSDGGQLMLIKLRNHLAIELGIEAQEVQDYAEECVASVAFYEYKDEKPKTIESHYKNNLIR